MEDMEKIEMEVDMAWCRSCSHIVRMCKKTSSEYSDNRSYYSKCDDSHRRIKRGANKKTKKTNTPPPPPSHRRINFTDAR